MDLNLSGWIERRKRDVGPYADHIIKQTGQYEREIERLRAELDRLTDFIRHIAKTNGKIHGDMVSVAKAEVITAHNDAIESVAQAADAKYGGMIDSAAIRALKK